MRKLIIILFILCVCHVSVASIDFDGVDDTMDCGSGTSLDNLGSMSTSQWLYINSLGGASTFDRLWAKDCTSADCNYLFINGNNSDRLEIAFNDYAVNHVSTTTPATGQWINIIVTYDGSGTGANAKIYVDGSEVSYSASANGTDPDDSGGNWYIGNRADGARSLDALFARTTVWNDVLSASEIAEAAAGKDPSRISVDSLVADWRPTNDSFGSSADAATIPDRSGNGNTCTASDGANNTGLAWAGDPIQDSDGQFFN